MEDGAGADTPDPVRNARCKEVKMLYRMTDLKATTAMPRVVDAHGLLHLKAPKATKACDAADAVDGLVHVQNLTLRLAAAAWGVSLGSVARAHALHHEERDEVRRGRRPLVIQPEALPEALRAVMPVPMSPEEKLAELVAEVGVSATLTMLAAIESTVTAV
jgi:hypothetical protein